MGLKYEVSRNTPTLVIFTIDTSISTSVKMGCKVNDPSVADVIKEVINTYLYELISLSNYGNEYRDYFYCSVIGYGGEVYDMLSKYNDSKDIFIPITNLLRDNMKTTTKRIVNGYGVEQIIRYYNLIDYKPGNKTPMYSALDKVYNAMERWIKSRGNRTSNILLINITDGVTTDSTDSELIGLSKKIKSLRCPNGEVIFANINIANNSSTDEQIIFPYDRSEVEGDKQAELLFDMSTEFSPEISQEIATVCKIEWNDEERLRAFSYNLSLNNLFTILQIGTLSLISK